MRRALHVGRLGLALALGLVAPPAEAQAGPAGAVHAHVLASPREDFGAALTGELTVPFDALRVGGFLGVGAVPSADDVYNRVFLPLGLTVGVDVLGDSAGSGPSMLGFALRARGGVWAGATQDVKLTAGGFLGGGAFLLFALGAGVSASVGLDVWGILGDGETVLFAPGAGLTWTPPVE